MDEFAAKIKPRFLWGNIYPRGGSGARRGESYQFYQLVPKDVMEISVRLGIRDYGKDDIAEAIARFRECVDALAAEKVNCIVLGGAPISAQLGRTRVRQLLDEAQNRLDIPAYAPLEAMIAGLKHLGIEKVAVASRWAAEVNDALAAYLRDGGIDVVATTTRGQWAREAHEMDLEQGMQMALEVAREAAQMAPGSQAIIAPGGATLTLHVIPAIEQEFGKVAMTNLSAEVWCGLLHTGVIPPLEGWGKLLATR
jgi:maleate cis-trans isomerase